MVPPLVTAAIVGIVVFAGLAFQHRIVAHLAALDGETNPPGPEDID